MEGNQLRANPLQRLGRDEAPQVHVSKKYAPRDSWQRGGDDSVSVLRLALH